MNNPNYKCKKTRETQPLVFGAAALLGWLVTHSVIELFTASNHQQEQVSKDQLQSVSKTLNDLSQFDGGVPPTINMNSKN